MSGLVRYISVLLVTDLKYMMMMMSVLVSWCFCVLEFLCVEVFWPVCVCRNFLYMQHPSSVPVFGLVII